MGSKDRKVRDAKTTELLAKGFALVPPKPEAAAVAAAVVTAPAAPVKAEDQVPVAEPAAAPIEQEKATSSSAGNSWWIFLLGMAAGFVVFRVLTFFISRQRSRRQRW